MEGNGKCDFLYKWKYHYNMGKVNLSLSFTKYHAMKRYGGAEEYPQAFLISTLDGG